MSLILDALHKAERERRAEEQAPDLQVIHGPRMQDARATGRWRVLALALTALLVGVAVFYLMPVPEDDAASAPVRPDAPGAEAPPDEPPRSVGAAAPASVAVVQSDDFALAPPQSSEAEPNEVESLYRAAREAPAADASPRSDWSEPLAEQVPAEEPVEWSERAEYESLPSILDLPERTRDGIPSIRYTEHRYSGDVSSDAVVLNGASLKKGDSVGADLYLVQILDDAIVLEFRGQRFRLTKFNNWINM